MREKYIAIDYPFLSIGEKRQDGLMDVSNLRGDLDLIMPLEEAKQLVKSWNAMQQKLVSCALAFHDAAPDKFHEFWYGEKL